VRVSCKLLAAVCAALCLPSAAAARTISYHGLHVHVPRGWSVYDLARHPHTCVRFDRHAIYLGVPGAAEDCPTSAAGRTDAILIEPSRASATTGLTGARVTQTALGGLGVTATWSRDPATVERILGVRHLRPAPAVAHAARVPARGFISSATVSAPAAAVPGQVFTGRAFDACSTPSAATMSAWRSSSPYGAIGVYIGGTNMACSQTNLTSTWVSAQSAAGWHLLPIYVGLQAPGNGCGCAALSSSPATAAAQGAAASTDAITRAQAIGLGPGNPIDFDMEAYPHTAAATAAVLAFLGAWTQGLHAAGYLSGVYSSDGSGISDLVAQYGTSFAEPDEIWFANWNGSASTADSTIPQADWAAHQRLHQYVGGHDETYGGARLNIDGDYLDAPTAAYGATSASAAGAGTTSTTGGAPTTTTTPVTTTPTTTTPAPTPTTPVPAASPFWLYSAAGNVYGSPWFGSPAASRLHIRISGMAATPDRRGYWLTTASGAIYAYGDATALSGRHATNPVVGILAAPGGGVWLLTTHGNVYNLGGAPFYGSPAAHRIRLSDVAGMAATPDGGGYWLITTAGTVLAYGDARPLPAVRSSHPLRGILAAPDGGAYAYTAYGNVYNLGGATWYGSHRTRTPTAAGLTVTGDGAGYWLLSTTGGAYAFGDATPVVPIRPAHPLVGGA